MSIPNQPVISNILADPTFRAKLLSDPKETLINIALPPEETEAPVNLQAATLKAYAWQIKMKLLADVGDDLFRNEH